ncbi:MAG: LytTR family DNA-binding domain-containing protein [Alistipes sp.]|nr:LytTR family DNA-binding domain-containing protein [Alistipes sp.]
MKCIIVDDEPLAREAIEMLVAENGTLSLAGKFNSAAAAHNYMEENPVDLVFLDIRMPGTTGIEFARRIPRTTPVVFTTAYAEYALDSYEVEAVDYLVKPVRKERFDRAVEKASAYHKMLVGEEKAQPGNIGEDHFFVKSQRRFFKVNFGDILFIEGLKDYVIIQMTDQRVITKMTVKGISELLPAGTFMRVNRSYIVNTARIDSFDTNDIFIGKHEIAIGASYKEDFYTAFISGKGVGIDK